MTLAAPSTTLARARALSASTWALQGNTVEATDPTPFALQAIRVTPVHPRDELALPDGVPWVRLPGALAGMAVTMVSASDRDGLPEAVAVLSEHLGDRWLCAPLTPALAVVSALARGDFAYRPAGPDGRVVPVPGEEQLAISMR